jgi:hypothetical protein
MVSPVIKSSPKHLVRIECTSFQGEYARVIPGWTNVEAALRLLLQGKRPSTEDAAEGFHCEQPFRQEGGPVQFKRLGSQGLAQRSCHAVMPLFLSSPPKK